MVKVTKKDARRALVRHHFAPATNLGDAFQRLNSVQFDPIAPVGCNHDLVLQSRVPGYQIGDWQAHAYADRQVYDGWDKQACLVRFESWNARRLFHDLHRSYWSPKIFDAHPEAVEAILAEITERGPLMPRDFEFQSRRDEWEGSWHGPSLTKQTLRALWHAGQIMTTDRRAGQHVYDLTERVVPPEFWSEPRLSREDEVKSLVRDRHRTMGLLRPNAAQEVWSISGLPYGKREAITDLVQAGEIIPVEIDGVRAHATPEFLALLDQPPLEKQLKFIAPLDPFMWDRKMIQHLFDFEYIWEIYTPEAKRRWGYYVLPILLGDNLVARVEFWCRDALLEIRAWHWESPTPPATFWDHFDPALRAFMRYCGAKTCRVSADDSPLKAFIQTQFSL